MKKGVYKTNIVIPGGRWNRLLDTETEPMSLIRAMIWILSQNDNLHLKPHLC